jgi:hypothetical protein
MWCIENDVSNNSSIAACVIIPAVMFLPSLYLAIAGIQALTLMGGIYEVHR